MLILPDTYLFTPLFQESVTAYLDSLAASLQSGVRLVRLRMGCHVSLPESVRLVNGAVSVCRRYHARLMLGGEHCSFADESGGLHLAGHSLMWMRQRPDWPGLLAASCHNRAQVAHACHLGVDFIVISPVLATPSHPDATPLDWQGFRALAEYSSVPVYALGGMQPMHIPLAKGAGAVGIAAIRGLWQGQ